MLVISRNEKKIFMQIHDPANDNSAYYEGRERRDKCVSLARYDGRM